jgi:CRP/FNR family transcriptional regulator, anaerobic regulatory protein
VAGAVTTDAILGLFDFYRLAAPESRAQLAAATTAVSLRKGAAFYREGDVCQHFGLVGRGDIRVFKGAATGREITLYHVRDGEPCLLNMLSVFLNRPAAASAVVEAETEAIVVPANVIRTWLSIHETVRTFVFEAMSVRLTDVMTLAVEVSIRRMDVRLASLLLRQADVNGAIHLTHDELATELGTAREVVSRLLKELERSGALHLGRGHVAIVDPSMLASMTASGP